MGNADPNRHDPLDSSGGPVESSLNVSAWRRLHLRQCHHCRFAHRVFPECPAFRLHHAFQYDKKVTLVVEPPPEHFDNYPLVHEGGEAIQAALDAFDDMHAFSEGTAEKRPYLNPLQAVKRPKGKRKHLLMGSKRKIRICFDLSRNFHQWCRDWPFRYSSVEGLVELILPNSWMPAVDLKVF